MEQWYTLYTKPNSEYIVAANLRQRGFHTYLPEIKKGSQQSSPDRKPFFPCYLFIKLDLDRHGITTVRWTPGLRRLVAFGDRPVPLAEEIMRLLQEKLTEIEAAGGQASHNFQPGEVVRITSGPFQDMLAVFEGPTSPSQRVHVLLEILGRASRVYVDPAELAKSKPADDERGTGRRTRGRGRRIKN